MASNFPTSLQDLDATRGTTGQTLSQTNHITHHTLEDDTIEALETKVGADSSAVATSLDYLLKNISSSNPGHKHTLANGATDLTASATEINKLDGLATTQAELEYVNGVTSAIQTQLAGKEATLTKGNLTETTSSILTITGGTSAIIGSGLTIAVAQADTSTNGYLSSTNWNTFNNKAASGANSDITSLTGLTTPLSAAYGGTGVANNAASTITITGAYTLGLTLSNTTAITLPTTGTLATTLNKLSDFAATTSAELAGVISDETGSGALVFGTSPTFTTQITAPLIYGDSADNGDITIEGTSSATKTTSYVNLQTTGGNVGIGTTTPGRRLAVVGNTGVTNVAAIGVYSASTLVIDLQANNAVYGPTIQFPTGGGFDMFNFRFFGSDGTYGYRWTTKGSGAASSDRLTISGNVVTANVIFASSIVGIGITPTAVLHLKAGTATASTAPLKFTSGTLLTNPEAGAVEFLNDAYYGTITTGGERKTFAFLESPSFTTPDIGTPSAGTLTNCTGLPAAAVVAGSLGTGAYVMDSSLQVSTIELGHATQNTLSASGGVLSIESVVIPTISSTNTLTNKRITPRVTTEASSATPTINTDNSDMHSITALAADITSFTTNLSGTPTNGQKLLIRILDNGTARAIAWGASFEDAGVALPTTTVISKLLTVGFIYNTVTSKWGCVAVGNET